MIEQHDKAHWASALYEGVVTHHRLRPKKHKLRYRVFSFLLDLDEIDDLASRLRLFSRNRFNLFSFHDRDHADGGTKNLRTRLETILADHGLRNCAHKIQLLCYPRLLGFVFNPLSVYFCHRADGSVGAVLYEVSNTFGDRHSYLIPVGEAGIDDKAFCANPVPRVFTSRPLSTWWRTIISVFGCLAKMLR